MTKQIIGRGGEYGGLYILDHAVRDLSLVLELLHHLRRIVD